MVEMATQLSFSIPGQNIDKGIYSPQKDIPGVGLQAKPYRYECNICHKVYNYKSSVEYHEDIHKNPEHKKLFVCNLCEKAFASSTEMKSHTMLHFEEKPIHCSLCDAKFTQSSYLRKHINVHHDYPFQLVQNKKLFSGCSFAICDLTQ